MIGIAYSKAIVGGTFNPRGLLDVIGGPAWLDTDRYEFVAKAEGARLAGCTHVTENSLLFTLIS